MRVLERITLISMARSKIKFPCVWRAKLRCYSVEGNNTSLLLRANVFCRRTVRRNDVYMYFICVSVQRRWSSVKGSEMYVTAFGRLARRGSIVNLLMKTPQKLPFLALLRWWLDPERDCTVRVESVATPGRMLKIVGGAAWFLSRH